MPPAEETDRDQAFCDEIVGRGWVTEAQVGEARRLLAAAEELGQPTTLDEVFVRKGFLTRERAVIARRDVAAKLGQSLRVGKYEILQRLGEGGSGIVYRAFQTTLGREVALKVLSQRREGEEEYVDRFMREAKVAVTLNHVNIVRGLDFGHADGYHYFAMELVEGESLLALVRREGRLDEGRALDVALQMVRALAHASQYQIVHRDIKPENILITKSGTAKLCDLGLARPVIQGGVADSTGRPMGTALYVAPEQIRHEGKLDFRADIYSLGATIFHALTGAPPYSGATVTEIVRAHLSAPVPNPRDIVIEISTGAAAVVMKMLSKDPQDRYQSLEALEEDLDSVIDGRPPVNTITIGRRAIGLGEGAAARGERRKASKWVAPAVFGISLAAIAAGGWFVFLRKKEPPPPPPPPPPPLHQKEDPAVLDAERIREARENDAAKALADALEFGKAHGEDSEESVKALVDVASAFSDTSSGRTARGKADVLEKRRLDRVGEALKTLGADFEAALAGGRLADALAVWKGMSTEVATGGGAKAAEEARGRVETAALALLEAARKHLPAAGTGDEAAVEAARKGLEAAAASGVEEVAAEARAAREALDAAVVERRRRWKAAEDAWPGVCVEALTAARRGTKAGLAVVDAGAEVLAPLGPRVADLRSFVEQAGSFEAAARGGFGKAAAAGETIRLRAPGRPGGVVVGRAAGVREGGFEIQRGPAVEVVAPDEVDPADIALLAWRVLGTGSASDHRGAAAFYLSRGLPDAAADEVKALEVMGAAADADRARALLEAVRVAARARAEEALREAEVLRIQKRLPEARAAYERAAELAGEDPRPSWKLGAFLLETTRENAEAAKWLEAAAGRNPPDAEAWFWIGEGRRRTGKVEEALTAFEKYMEAAPADDALREPARKALEEIRAAAAATAVRQAREDAARAYRKDDFAASEPLWRNVLRYSPDDTEAMYFLGKSLLALEKRLDGYSWLRRFLNAEKRPGSRTDDAKRVVKDLEQRFGESVPARRKATEGTGYIDDGKYPEARAAFDESISLAPLRPETYVERARLLLFVYAAESRKEDLNQALQDLETALLINEKLGRAWSMLTVVRFNLGDFKGSVDASARAVPLDPNYPSLWEFRARACNETGRFAEAEAAASEGIQRFPGASLLIARADARRGLGKLPEARADLDEAATKFRLTPADSLYRAQVLGRVLKDEKAGE